MTRFEPMTSEIGSDRSTNWATTTAHPIYILRDWPFTNYKALNDEALPLDHY